ncbi:hypothetical protein BOO69_16525 [Sulfitobacter alexandrii]|uniref:Methyltransferase FkbM domain-containing protein n=1 Tax=Sulfitobacter alexandrii TaxID=1917485 RepID=A0A1J0WKG0_9RHOB|nr:FkbM family methyltransferase [Sulfitobacter alexandrii]APE44825.1 hypothetical protein BOO69_16525 [Sulfitobacter alexandrii]
MSISSELHKIWKLATDPEFRAYKRQVRAFYAAQGRGTPERYQGLKPGDTVLDVGAYRGDWAERMTTLYGVRVHCFEPHPRFARHLHDRFREREDVAVEGYAMGRSAGVLKLSDDENASSALVTSGDPVEGEVRPASEVFDTLGLDRVACIKMNIEGGEYDLLPAMIDAGLMPRVDRLTVQFHRYGPEQEAQRDAIRADLARTHRCAWEYPFIWEEWVRLDA